MRHILLVIAAVSVCVLIAPWDASAARPLAGKTHSLFTCANGDLSRVALSLDTAPCCTGSFGCPHLLSNTGLLKRKPDNQV